MVLATSTTSSIYKTPACHVSPALGKANLDRIPVNILKKLMKMRPRVQHSSSDSSEAMAEAAPSETKGKVATTPKAGSSLSVEDIPAQYAIVEYFGSHDFGWVRADTR